MKIAAEWTDDCSGKKDFDGQILSISTRYWPRGGGFLEFSPEGGFRDNEDRPHIKPSAKSTVYLHSADDDIVLATAEFEDETEEGVKQHVEKWADDQYQKIVATIRTLFPVDV